ncbi:hypothetical protein KAFR_0I00900 [Kazachstania africana CBS 2517]|uniref:DUF676 domain-containing protein n=1 Tax=Kazachstania africana (strain ATCC 22294 / BCRC 22015 / CBS 2517 / CECT 1963 / NBRC 1671 / NRRL Y-8276) TaxID=1071382 RepID=H2AZS1_KAZAF|nr:hypothetical protein KAFR_0I00900 [Kazachstania africana CBS 2517]CCF59871.1 hypothetical protein KAFR_0I00900 [Kazachstania africana CBS 2517]
MSPSFNRKGTSHLTEGHLLVHETRTLGVGDLTRFKLTIDKGKLDTDLSDVRELFVKIKNKESALLRPIYLTGPYAFYVDVRPHNYNEETAVKGDEPIQFCEDLKPDEKFKAKLFFNENSNIEGTTLYSWTIDIISQLAVIIQPCLNYSIKIGTTKYSTRRRFKNDKVFKRDYIALKEWDTLSLWSLPPKFPKKPVHLVILTHGIFSNIGCDMLYMKDKIEEIANSLPEDINSNVVVRGCMNNMGKSAHGVHYLGKRVGEYVIKTIDELNEDYKVDKISFIGHSLGGPTQSMAVRYISVKRPDIFNPQNGIKPINFIALASPFIGVIGDFPMYISLPLDMGALGLTGRDLNLKYTPLTSKDGLFSDAPKTDKKHLPKLIMEILPLSPAKSIFERFVNRTLYANIVHDGIVPLRTAALLYLDWKSLAKVKKIQKKEASSPAGELGGPIETTPTSESSTNIPEPDETNVKTGEIPQDSLDKKAALQWAMPQSLIRNRNSKKFKRGQINGTDSESEDDDTDVGGSKKKNKKKFSAPDEASTLLSALSVLTAPVPSQEYIKNPETRSDSVVHDKLYHPEDLPPPHYQSRPGYKRIIYPNETVNRVQERIARAWQESMPWRKVLVKIQPDAHNNIVVRRRFVNLYGNVAISHMVQEHFGKEATERYTSINTK